MPGDHPLARPPAAQRTAGPKPGVDPVGVVEHLGGARVESGQLPDRNPFHPDSFPDRTWGSLPPADDRRSRGGHARTGQTIVLLGGLYRAELLRSTLAPVLAQDGHRVLTPGWGVGADAGVERPGPTVATLAAEVAAQLARRGAAPCVVLGDAIGAPVALELALTCPRLVRALILSAAGTAPSALCRGVYAEIAGRLTTGEPIQPKALALLRALQLFSPRALADDRFMTGALELLTRLPPELPAQRDLVTAALDYQVSRERLAEIGAPCLVLAYEHDAVTPVHRARELAGWIPGARLRTLGLGHGGPIEDPRQVAHALSGFLADHAAEG